VVDKWHLLHFELISEDFPCPNEYFKCTEGHCVAPQFVCDGHKHCIDGDDEINCGKYTPLCFVNLILFVAYPSLVDFVDTIKPHYEFKEYMLRKMTYLINTNI
jgi:hypothetical protein